jgi:hypothetical protein
MTELGDDSNRNLITLLSPVSVKGQSAVVGRLPIPYKFDAERGG